MLIIWRCPLNFSDGSLEEESSAWPNTETIQERNLICKNRPVNSVLYKCLSLYNWTLNEAIQMHLPKIFQKKSQYSKSGIQVMEYPQIHDGNLYQKLQSCQFADLKIICTAGNSVMAHACLMASHRLVLEPFKLYKEELEPPINPLAARGKNNNQLKFVNWILINCL